MISVITPSIRSEGLPIVQKALQRQNMQEYEWIVGSPFKPNVDCLWVNDDFKDGFWSLNRIYNKMISKAKGELLVSWQDFTFANPDGLGKFWFHYEQEPKTLVTGVGNKYKDDTWNVKTWQDPRERDDIGSYYSCYPNDIEWNYASIPKEAIYDIGGFDEEMDFLGFGMDGLAVNERIDELKLYDFKIDQTNKSFSLDHDRHKGWEENNLLHGGYLERKNSLIDINKYPVLSYLNR